MSTAVPQVSSHPDILSANGDCLIPPAPQALLDTVEHHADGGMRGVDGEAALTRARHVDLLEEHGDRGLRELVVVRDRL